MFPSLLVLLNFKVICLGYNSQKKRGEKEGTFLYSKSSDITRVIQSFPQGSPQQKDNLYPKDKIVTSSPNE